MKKSTEEYIDNLKKYMSEIKKHINVNEFEKNIKDYKKYVIKLKEAEYFIPLIIIVIFLVISMVITQVNTSSLKSKNQEVSFAANPAEEAFYSGKYENAIEAYTKLQKKEQWPIWNLKIAEIYSVQGQLVKSNQMIEEIYNTRNKIKDTSKDKIEEFDTKDRELTNYIVFTTLVNGEVEKALEYGEVFLKDYPSDKNLLKTMYTVYIASGNPDEAKKILAEYDTVTETAKDLADLAQMYMLIDDYDKSFTLLFDAWNKDKNEVKILDVIEQMADYNQTDILNRILKLEESNPDEIAYKMWKAKIYLMNKEYFEKANEIITDLDSKQPLNINLLLMESEMYLNLGENEKSNEALDKIVNNNSNTFIGYYASALKDYNNENYDDALINCDKSVELNKDYTNNYAVFIPKILEKKQKSEETESYLRTALYKEPFNYNITIKTAEYYGNTLSDSTKALNYYNLASKIRINDADIYYNMALININNQRTDEACELLKTSIAINNKSPKYHRALGTVYINTEKYEEALKEIKNAYSIDNTDILTLNNAACYYVAIDGDVERSMTNMKAAYDGINDKTLEEDKVIIYDNYEKVKSLYDAYNKRDGATLTVPQLQLFY